MAASVDTPQGTRPLVGPVTLDRTRTLVPGARLVAQYLIPNYRDAVRREQWTRSARALARLAVELRLQQARLGSYPNLPPDLPRSAATGETVAYRVLDDGSAELAFPEAEATWLEYQRQQDLRGKISTADLNLRWRLPGPDGGR